MEKIKSLDIVVPVYNEGACLQNFHASLLRQIEPLAIPFHVIYVNDGSADDTQAKLEELSRLDSHVRAVELSRNFGHQAALTCGMAESEADWVITMDGDGEHPADKIPEMILQAQNGADIVLTQRQEAQSASLFKRWTSDGFYKLIGRITATPILQGVGDFRLMRRSVVDALNAMPEYHRFLRGMVAWAGFRTAVVPYSPAKRMGGVSKYSLKKMFKLAQDAIFSFSLAPIIITLVVGLVFLLASLIVGIAALIQPLFQSPADSLIVFLLLLCSGSIITSVAVIGFYSGMTFQQIKWRPNYIVRSRLNFQKNKG